MTLQVSASKYHTTTAGTRLHYLQAGSPSGSLLLCLHGLGGSSETFSPLVPHLPSTYNIVLLDFPGFGKSLYPTSSKKISVTQHVADVGELIASLQRASPTSETRDVVIIGHSLGAIVALQYAAQYPQTIGGLALLGAGRAAGHIPAVRERMCKLAATVRTEGIAIAAEVATKSNFYEDATERTVEPRARDAVRQAVLASDPEAYAQTCEAVVDVQHKDPHYTKIVAPAVFIAGDRDAISPIGRSEELSTLLGGPSWVEVVKSGHQPILEDIQGVKQAVEKLLGSVAVCSAARALKDP